MNDNIVIKDIILHYVGCKASEEGVVLSTDVLQIAESVNPYLKFYFLSQFKLEALCNFFHESKLPQNKMFSYVEDIFERKRPFNQVSSNIATYLYDHSNHPKIKGGDFFVVLFDNMEVDHKSVEAIGLFKVENKDRFITISRSGDHATVNANSGVNIQKLDKGCLIFNVEKENGYVVAVIDKTSRGGEAHYWIDDFLHVVPRSDNYNQTKNALSVCKAYIKSLSDKVDKSQRAIMLNKLAELLKDGEFDMVEVSEKVFSDSAISADFTIYKQQRDPEAGEAFGNHFKTDPTALKRLTFGNLTSIKLDDNFGISIKGGGNLIEKGFDEKKGMKYYKLYYKEEK